MTVYVSVVPAPLVVKLCLTNGSEPKDVYLQLYKTEKILSF